MGDFAMRIVILLASVALVLTCSAVAEAQRNYNPIDLKGRATSVVEKHFHRAYYWHRDISFLIEDEKTKKTWRIVSRDCMPNEARWMFGPTYTGLKVDWKSKPRVRVVGVDAVDRPDAGGKQAFDRPAARFYDLKLDEENCGTAMIIWVEVKPDVWKEYYVNNWIHRWGPKADKFIHSFYADKGKPYEVFGWWGGKACPFVKGSHKLFAKYPKGQLFHGWVKSAPGTEFGYVLTVKHLMGKDRETRESHVFHGDPKTLPSIHRYKPKGKGK
jgi:hypothetical protein